VKESLQRECSKFIGGEIIAKVAGARLGGKAGVFTVVRRRKVFRHGGFKVVFLWIRGVPGGTGGMENLTATTIGSTSLPLRAFSGQHLLLRSLRI
jgi:hypothetical protein